MSDVLRAEKMHASVPSRQGHLTTDALIPIWEKVLDRSPISAEDNFFDLGGDSTAAVALSLAIEEATGHSVPATTIFEAPTVAALAKKLERVAAQFSPLVLLKHGDSDPPLFMAAGAGGSIVYFSRTARSISCNHPVYAIEVRGLDGVHPPHDRIEQMAETCLKSMKARQPNGPYLLAGHSLGGLVMLEVAQELICRGEEIALLVLIDTYPHPRYWPVTSWVGGMARNFTLHASNLMRSPLGDLLPGLANHSKNFIDHVRVRCSVAARHRGSAALAALPEQMRSVAKSSREAWTSYRPRYYPGTITFFRAEVLGGGGIWPIEPAAIWGRLAHSLEIHSLPGNHRTVLAGHTKVVAAQLSHSIERALAVTTAETRYEAEQRGGAAPDVWPPAEPPAGDEALGR